MMLGTTNDVGHSKAILICSMVKCLIKSFVLFLKNQAICFLLFQSFIDSDYKQYIYLYGIWFTNIFSQSMTYIFMVFNCYFFSRCDFWRTKVFNVDEVWISQLFLLWIMLWVSHLRYLCLTPTHIDFIFSFLLEVW